MQKHHIFYLKIFIFFEVKFSIYLNRRVFVTGETSQGNTHNHKHYDVTKQRV